MDYFAEMEFDEAPSPQPAERREIDGDDILRIAAWTRPFPLPEHLVPTEGGMLSDVDDEVFMCAPPHLIVHLQRTAAQGGLQVISPRQTPITSLMSRTVGPHRSLGDHVVGSLGCDTEEWPTIDNYNFDFLLPDEPLPIRNTESTARHKTKTEPITKAGHLLSDPILSCLIKGRAVIDLLRRDDVGGNADTMTTLLAEAWGVNEKDICDLDAFTLGIDGPLLRHAIKADEVYPMVHAPIHHKKTISVGASEISRDLLADDTAMDWRRMRVFCEAVFLMTCSIEGIPIKYAVCYPPPGDPTAALNRPNIMAFRPAPCVAWSFEPKSFSIYPTVEGKKRVVKEIPREVLTALSKYLEIVKPLSYAIAGGHKPRTLRSVTTGPIVPVGETINQGYKMLLRTMEVGMVRGRNSSRAVRNAIFEALEGAEMSVRLRIARYIKIAKRECEIHLGLSEVPDLLVEKIANKFLTIGELIRTKVVSEAARRGHNKNDWWADIVSQAPERYKILTEGTMGWAKIGMWLAFKSPIDRWNKLVNAVNYRALRDAAKGELGGIPLPPHKGSAERLMAVSRAVVSRVSKSFMGYYMAVTDVGLALADVADDLGKTRTADRLREGAYLWCLRARALRGTNVNAIAKDSLETSMNHMRVKSEPHDLLVVPAPYRAFEAYARHLEKSEIIAPSVKKSFREGMEKFTKKSDIFRTLDRTLIPGAESTVTRYLTKPHAMADSLEKAWSQIKEDVDYACRVYALELNSRTSTKRPLEEIAVFQIPLLKIPERDTRPGFSYFDLMADLGEDQLDWFEAELEKLDPEQSEDFENGRYADEHEMRSKILKMSEERINSLKPAIETVV